MIQIHIPMYTRDVFIYYENNKFLIEKIFLPKSRVYFSSPEGMKSDLFISKTSGKFFQI
jgi:hypothetical protein